MAIRVRVPGKTLRRVPIRCPRHATHGHGMPRWTPEARTDPTFPRRAQEPRTRGGSAVDPRGADLDPGAGRGCRRARYVLAFGRLETPSARRDRAPPAPAVRETRPCGRGAALHRKARGGPSRLRRW